MPKYCRMWIYFVDVNVCFFLSVEFQLGLYISPIRTQLPHYQVILTNELSSWIDLLHHLHIVSKLSKSVEIIAETIQKCLWVDVLGCRLHRHET